MPLWNASELNEIFNCSLPSDFTCTGFSIDTRTLKPGEIFFAIQGVSQDGHAYAPLAAEKGAAAVVVSTPLAGRLSCPQIVVDDTLKAMVMMGRYARHRSKATVIAVTGSVGKTSTKEILAHVLSQFGEVSCAEASYNNHWGVPLTLCRIPRTAKFAIVEIGMNNPGEIAPLSELVKPHVAIITAVAPAHIGHMGSLDAIVREKAAVFSGLEPEGIVIIPSQPDHFSYFKSQAQSFSPKMVLSFGGEPNADVQLLKHESVDGDSAQVKVKIHSKDISFSFPLVGRHLANNSLIAFALARALRLDLDKVARILTTMPAIKNRCHLHHLDIDGNRISLLDDSYNANLASMTAGIETVLSLEPGPKGRRIAVLGEMLELGDFAIDHHQQLAQLLVDKDVDKVYLCGGTAMKQCHVLIPESKRCAYAATASELVPEVLSSLQDGDVVLVKGSKGSRVSLVAEAILEKRNLSQSVGGR